MHQIARLLATAALAGAVIAPTPAFAAESPLPKLPPQVCQAPDADLPPTASVLIGPFVPQAPSPLQRRECDSLDVDLGGQLTDGVAGHDESMCIDVAGGSWFEIRHEIQNCLDRLTTRIEGRELEGCVNGHVVLVCHLTDDPAAAQARVPSGRGQRQCADGDVSQRRAVRQSTTGPDGYSHHAEDDR